VPKPITLEFLAQQNERVLTDLASLRDDLERLSGLVLRFLEDLRVTRERIAKPEGGQPPPS
jgi:hypothetical protein